MSASIAAVIPVFNGERYIREAVDSALAQTRPADEIIVVDDGSTDGTPEVLRGYGARLRVVRTPNRGLSAARNEGFRASRSDYAAFLDADDRWRPEKLAVFAEKAAAHPGIGLFFSDAISMSAEGRPRRMMRCPPLDGIFFDHLLVNNWVISSTVMVPARVPESVGPLRSDFLHPAGVVDWEYFLRVARRWPVLHVPRALTEYRQHEAGAMHTALEKLRADNLKVVSLHAEGVPASLRRDAEASVRLQSAVRFLAALDGSSARRDLVRAMASPRFFPTALFYWASAWGGRPFLALSLRARRLVMALGVRRAKAGGEDGGPDRLYPPPEKR